MMESSMSSVSSVPPDFEPITKTIRKRDGVTIQSFEVEKIRRAVSKAWLSEYPEINSAAVERVIRLVVTSIENVEVTVEDVQDLVELALMKIAPKVAKHYILYREERAKKRALVNRKPDPKAVSDYIHAGKYARHRSDLGRREVYAETVERCRSMHAQRFPHLAAEISEAFEAVARQDVLPSMRSLQFSGEAILHNHCKLFNCTFGHIDRIEAFSEAMYLLLCGSGVGYSVQRDHVEKLPVLGFVSEKKVHHHIVEDTIEGWANAEKVLVQSYVPGYEVSGKYVEFSFHKIRDAGSPLRRSGGKAPGHVQLRKSLEDIRKILSGAQGRKLRPIECHHMLCHSADAPLSGGVRRSAMIALFSLDDNEMMDCKTGDWLGRAPWLQNANNSVVLVRGDVRRKEFQRVFTASKQWGEPGFFFTWDAEWGTNPCCEITFDPRLVIDEKIKAKLAKRDVQVEVGDVFSGWTFCNLTTINAAKLTSREDFLRAARAATFLGTLQATYTSFPYLGWPSEMLAERDALLGVSMTGMLDSPKIACDPDLQREVARHVRSWNRQFAEMFGIEPAARTTCVKPEGTASLELGGVASGHHPHHSRRYIRRVIADELEPVFQAFRQLNPQMCLERADGKWMIEFPVEVRPEAIVKADVGAVEFLTMVRSTQKNWVQPGTNPDRTQSHFGEPLHHNVSNTVHVKDEEWSAVADYLWEHRNDFTGVSFISERGDKKYPYAPFEAVVTEADEAYYYRLLAGYQPLDYTTIVEADDATTLRGEAACAGGACAIV